MIDCYDLEDNLITVFDNYKECAKWFNTSVKVIQCYICRSQKGQQDKIFCKENNQWYRLFKIREEEI